MPDSPRIGREARWFGRAGVALILTAFVLFVHYLNDRAQPAGGSLLWLGALSLIIFATGLFLEKLSRPWPGRAVVAAGLAAFYCTAFAAAYFTNPRSNGLPVAGAAGILIVTIAIVWFAERHQAPITTFFAVILAGYTTALQPILLITLFSNVVLVGAGGWFLIRHGRALLAFVTLAAAYSSYAIWWTYHDGGTDFARYLQLGEFWQTSALFAACWATIIACVFLTPPERLAREQRLAIISLDHALFFSLVIFLLPPMYANWLSGFSIAFGVAMTGTAALIGMRDPPFWHPASRQGFLVIALGLMTLFSGPSLALVGAIVSSLLLVTANAMTQWRSKALLLLAGAVALAATLLASESIQHSAQNGRTIGVLTGLILICNACGAVRTMASDLARGWVGFYFAALGGLLWFWTILYRLPAIQQPPTLALTGFALVLSFAFARVAAFPYVGSGLVLASQILWLHQIGSFIRPWWNPLLVVLVTLFLSAWWRGQGRTLTPGKWLKMVQIVAAIGVVAVLFFWLAPSLSPRAWLLTTSILAVATLLWGFGLRDRALAALGQSFAIVCIYEFVVQISRNPPLGPVIALGPAVMLLVLAWILDLNMERTPEAFRWVPPLYRGLAALTLVAWVVTYFPLDLQFLTLELCGFILLIWTQVRNEPVTLFSSVAFSGAAVIVAWTTSAGARGFHLLDLVAFALLLGQQQLSKRLLTGPATSPYVQNPGMVIGIVTLWRWVSLWSEYHFGGASLTIAWALLGLIVFVIGLLFREPAYRWLGWSLLIVATVRVSIFDSRAAGVLRTALNLAVVGVTMLIAVFFRSAHTRDNP
jgi:hypothetical protein